MADKVTGPDDIREAVRARYAAVAESIGPSEESGGSCCGPATATMASLGCGSFAVSDVVADQDMDAATRADMAQWTGCIAGALTRRGFEDALAAAGMVDVEVVETHRVHEKAASAIIRARKPLRSDQARS